MMLRESTLHASALPARHRSKSAIATSGPPYAPDAAGGQREAHAPAGARFHALRGVGPLLAQSQKRCEGKSRTRHHEHDERPQENPCLHGIHDFFSSRRNDENTLRYVKTVPIS